MRGPRLQLGPACPQVRVVRDRPGCIWHPHCPCAPDNLRRRQQSYQRNPGLDIRLVRDYTIEQFMDTPLRDADLLIGGGNAGGISESEPTWPSVGRRLGADIVLQRQLSAVCELSVDRAARL